MDYTKRLLLIFDRLAYALCYSLIMFIVIDIKNQKTLCNKEEGWDDTDNAQIHLCLARRLMFGS